MCGSYPHASQHRGSSPAPATKVRNARWKQAVTHLLLGPPRVQNHSLTVRDLCSLRSPRTLAPVEPGAREGCPEAAPGAGCSTNVGWALRRVRSFLPPRQQGCVLLRQSRVNGCVEGSGVLPREEDQLLLGRWPTGAISCPFSQRWDCWLHRSNKFKSFISHLSNFILPEGNRLPVSTFQCGGGVEPFIPAMGTFSGEHGGFFTAESAINPQLAGTAGLVRLYFPSPSFQT